MNPRLSTLALLPLVLALPSCGLFGSPLRTKRVNFWLAENADLVNVRRVVVLPFTTAAGVDADTESLRDVFVKEFMKLQRFELVPIELGANEERVLRRALDGGRISTAGLVGLAKRFNVDGIVLGTITSYRAYVPSHLGIRAMMVSLHAGSIVWSAEGFYDAADARTTEDIRHYAQNVVHDDENLHGWEMHLISPNRFASFVSHRIVGTWREATNR